MVGEGGRCLPYVGTFLGTLSFSPEKGRSVVSTTPKESGEPPGGISVPGRSTSHPAWDDPKVPLTGAHRCFKTLSASGTALVRVSPPESGGLDVPKWLWGMKLRGVSRELGA